MADTEDEGFAQLFASEPSDPTPHQTGEWLALYDGLIGLIERQLNDTHGFMETAPEPSRTYLRQEDLRILDEELRTLRDRRTWWAERS